MKADEQLRQTQNSFALRRRVAGRPASMKPANRSEDYPSGFDHGSLREDAALMAASNLRGPK
jgi:hypothetical protein